MAVFVALIEVCPLENSTLGDGVAGAMVRCHVSARSERDARAKIREHMRTENLAVEDWEWCVDAESVEWEDPDDPDFLRMLAEARYSDGVVCGPFHTWEAD